MGATCETRCETVGYWPVWRDSVRTTEEATRLGYVEDVGKARLTAACGCAIVGCCVFPCATHFDVLRSGDLGFSVTGSTYYVHTK